MKHTIDSLSEWIVANITYLSDHDVHGGDYWQHPTETLERMTGDCDCRAVLLQAAAEWELGWRGFLVVVANPEKDTEGHVGCMFDQCPGAAFLFEPHMRTWPVVEAYDIQETARLVNESRGRDLYQHHPWPARPVLLDKLTLADVHSLAQAGPMGGT